MFSLLRDQVSLAIIVREFIMQSPFRNIRMKLFLRRQDYGGHVISGKLLRYLGYAFGEIALIIVQAKSYQQ